MWQTKKKQLKYTGVKKKSHNKIRCGKKIYTFPTNVNRYVACNDTLLHFRHSKRCMHRKQRRIPIVFAITICVRCIEGEKACSSTMTNELNGQFFFFERKKSKRKKNSKKTWNQFEKWFTKLNWTCAPHQNSFIKKIGAQSRQNKWC